MKKRLVKFLTLILSVVMAAASLVGCNIVTHNTERDLNQVVATVNINQEENIYKKDLVMAYMNYGYYYVQYYGYDAATVYNMIINNLVDDRIMVQVAYEEFEKTSVTDGEKAKYTPERYLDGEEITDAKYNTYKSINDLLDSYSEDKSKTEKQDTLIFDVRTVPTGATNEEKELSDNEKKDYIAKGFDVSSDEYKRAAFNKVITLLKENGLLGDKYEGTLETTDYFTLLLKSNLESKIIEKYENVIKQEIINGVEYSALETLYNDKLNSQRAWSNSEFVSALSSATATSPILYSAFGTYGYVYNLLLGVNDYQSAKIAELQEKREHKNMSEADYSAERKVILAGTVAKDLRSSWILSGYDFDYESKKFTGDYTFAKNADYSLPFQGEVKELRAKTDDKDGVYSIESVDIFRLKEFTKFVNKYVYADESELNLSSHQDRYYEYDLADKPNTEYDAKINELLFAFSTDPGSLNTYKGYVIKPDNNEYVKTFGDAGKELLKDAADNAGKSGSYKVVASDYGYHFMFFSEVFTVEDSDNPRYKTLDLYLNSLDIDGIKTADEWKAYFNKQKDKWDDFEEENNFLYFLANELVSAKLSDKTTRNKTNVITEYRYGEHKDSTVIYKDRFSDLLG